jgi:NAD(P)-dependent dehydrogenase (short-subunit alcohol dehydrogenase family)
MSLKQRIRAGMKGFLFPLQPPARRYPAEPTRIVIEKLLAGRNVLVTGAGPNIGRAVALEAAAHGANVFCTDIDAEHCGRLAAELAAFPVRSSVTRSDITRDQDVDALCAALADAGVTIDVMINNVGVGGDDWRKVFETNVIGPMGLTRKISARMIERGEPASVIFITSIHQDTVFRRSPAYSASKSALAMVIKELALTLAPHRIRVNGVAPGLIAEDDRGLPMPHGFTPLEGSSISPRYVGRAAVYLASDYFSRHTTGAIITIDGGLSLFNYLSAVEAGVNL